MESVLTFCFCINANWVPDLREIISLLSISMLSWDMSYLIISYLLWRASLVGQRLKCLPACNAGVLGLIPGSGRSPGERNGYPLQYSWLETSMDRGAWQTTYSPWGLKRIRHDWATFFFFNVIWGYSQWLEKSVWVVQASLLWANFAHNFKAFRTSCFGRR